MASGHLGGVHSVPLCTGSFPAEFQQAKNRLFYLELKNSLYGNMFWVGMENFKQNQNYLKDANKYI